MKILKFPNPALFKKCQDVTVFGDELLVLLNAMWDTMLENKGIGLAANQVGLEYSMFSMLGPNDEKLFLINPKVLGKSIFNANLKEGCLSAPGELLIIPDRANWVVVEYRDETGTLNKKLFNGIHAICVQHEIEHLNGQIFMESKALPRSVRKNLATKWGFKIK